jgi:hypothetical protein
MEAKSCRYPDGEAEENKHGPGIDIWSGTELRIYQYTAGNNKM